MGWRDNAVRVEDSTPEWKKRAVPVHKTESQRMMEVPSKLESAARGAGQGVTLGFQDEASPIVERALGAGSQILGYGASALGFPDVASRLVTQGQPSVDASYKDLRSEYRGENQAAKEANPWTYGGAELAASIPTSVALSAVPGLQGASPMIQAAGAGALSAAGSSEAETLPGLALDTAVGAGAGALLGKAAEKLQSSMKNLAISSGRRALGFNYSKTKASGGLKKVNQAVETILDEGKVLKPQSIERMGKSLETIQDDAGKTIGAVLKRADEAGFDLVTTSSLIDDIKGAKVPGLDRTIAQVAEDEPLIAKELQDIIGRLEKNTKAGGATNFDRVNYVKKLLGKSINWKESDSAGNVSNMTKKLVYHAITDSLDRSLDDAAQALGSSAFKGDFVNAKKVYGAASTALRSVNDRITREAGNKAISITDWILGGGALAGGLAQGNPAIAIPLVVGKKLGEKFGAQTLSGAANAASKIPTEKAATVVGGMGGLASRLYSPREVMERNRKKLNLEGER